MDEKEITYAAAGVDILKGEKFTDTIKRKVEKAWPGGGKEIGGFAGGGVIPRGAKKFGTSTDGPGTKVKLAAMMGNVDGIGQDIVAMTAVDTYVGGYRPEAFLDYFVVDHLDPELHIRVIDSIIRGCKMAGCRLVGGETAEHSDFFKYKWMFDVNGFVIGFYDENIISSEVKIGQKLYGWLSGGVCANGTSMLRKVFNLNGSTRDAKRNMNKTYREFVDATLAEIILKPTPIWINDIEEQRIWSGVSFSGHAHITGGGFPGNVHRMLPDGFGAIIYRDRWQRPPIFRVTQDKGNISQAEMDKTFNNGIIMVSACDYGVNQPDHPSVVEIGEIVEWDGVSQRTKLIGEYCD